MRGSGQLGRVVPVAGGGNESSEAHVECVVAPDTLLPLGVEHIDFMSLDVEGNEADVLRCWPFDKLPIHALLMETTQFDLREVDRWFHRHEYDNVESISTGFGPVQGQIKTVYTDNLYVHRSRPALYPTATLDASNAGNFSAARSGWRCDKAALSLRSRFFCWPWMPWLPSPKVWGECDSSSPSHGRAHRANHNVA